MKQSILKIVNDIKDHLKQIDLEGVYHPLHDEIYESLALIEDEIYEDEGEDGIDISDYMD